MQNPKDEMYTPSTAPVANPFGGSKSVAPASATSDVARAVTEVQAGMLIARQFPRNEVAAMDKILNAFARSGLAEKAVYQYARGGSDIAGPSIRAAEALAQLWGNIYTGVRELEQRNGASTVEAFAWDTETGFHDVKVFQVPHMRHTKTAVYPLTDPRDIYEHVANAAARRKRACILAVIPADVIDSAMRQADVTMNTTAEATPERIAQMVDAFEKFGISREAIETRIQRRIDAISPAQIVQLGRIHNSLRDGMSTASDWFDVGDVTTRKAPDAAIDELNAGITPEKKIAAELKTIAPEATDESIKAVAEYIASGGKPQTAPPHPLVKGGVGSAIPPGTVVPPLDLTGGPNFADVLSSLRGAKSPDDIASAEDLARSLTLTEQQTAEVDVEIRAAMARIKK